MKYERAKRIQKFIDAHKNTPHEDAPWPINRARKYLAARVRGTEPAPKATWPCATPGCTNPTSLLTCPSCRVAHEPAWRLEELEEVT